MIHDLENLEDPYVIIVSVLKLLQIFFFNNKSTEAFSTFSLLKSLGLGDGWLVWGRLFCLFFLFLLNLGELGVIEVGYGF